MPFNAAHNDVEIASEKSLLINKQEVDKRLIINKLYCDKDYLYSDHLTPNNRYNNMKQFMG